MRLNISVNAMTPYLIFYLTTLTLKYITSYVFVSIDLIYRGRDLEVCQLVILAWKTRKVIVYPVVGYYHAVGNCRVLTYLGQKVRV